MDIVEQKVVPLARVREILEKVAEGYTEEGRELLYEQKRALEHARRFPKLSVAETEELISNLQDFNLKPEQIIKICDLLPETVDDVRAIFEKERFRYTEDEIKKIIDLVAQYK